MEEKRFTKQERSWMFYDWANSAYSILIASVLPIYAKALASAAGVSDTQYLSGWSFVSAFTGVIIAILAPILGTIADYRAVRKKFFVAFFVVGVLATGIIPVANAYAGLLILYAVTWIGFAGANVFYDSFLVDVTTPARMDRVSTWGFGLGYIGGSTIPFVVSIALIMFGKRIGVDQMSAMRISCLLTAVWWAVFSIPFLRNVKQVSCIEHEPHMIRQSFLRLGQLFREASRYRSLFLFLLAYFFYIDGVGTIITMATSYSSALGLTATTLTLGLLLVQVVAFPFSILYGKLSERFSAKKMIWAGIITYLLVCGVGFMMREAWHFYLLAFLVGTAQGGIQALSRSYFGKLVPDPHRAGEFFGLYNIFGKFETVLGTFLMGLVVSLTGVVNYGVLPVAAMFVIGAVLMLFVPDDKKVKATVSSEQ